MEKHELADPARNSGRLAKELFLSAIIAVEVFVMFFMSFPRLDDLTWGSSIGMQRLGTWFEGYNGRYVGNIIVIILTRLPVAFRAGVELIVFGMLFYCAYRLLPQKKAFCFFALGFLLLPLPLCAQSVVWTAGFANYVPSAVIMLFAMNTYCDVVFNRKELSRLGHLFFVVVTFLGQLILENTTLFMVVMAGGFLLWGLIKNKKLFVPTITGFISSACGALLMFSNTSYLSAIVGDGGNYKSLAVMPLTLWRKFQNEIIPHLVQNNHILNILLAITLYILWLSRNAASKTTAIEKLGRLFGITLIAFFGYDAIDSTWTKVLPHGKTIYAIISLLYAVYIIATIAYTIENKADKTMLLLFSGTQIILVAPLVPVAPLNARCFFQNGILWALILGYLLYIVFEIHLPISKSKCFESGLIIFVQVTCVAYLAFVLCGQSLSWHIQQIRIEEAQNRIEDNAETIILPEIPWSSVYCYGANISNNNNYWLTNYKRYYGIPSDIKLEFMDYYKWIEKYMGSGD